MREDLKPLIRKLHAAGFQYIVCRCGRNFQRDTGNISEYVCPELDGEKIILVYTKVMSLGAETLKLIGEVDLSLNPLNPEGEQILKRIDYVGYEPTTSRKSAHEKPALHHSQQ